MSRKGDGRVPMPSAITKLIARIEFFTSASCDRNAGRKMAMANMCMSSLAAMPQRGRGSSIQCPGTGEQHCPLQPVCWCR
ncbi:unnamed protein product [Durusdinium trenchii]|uniref:Uncharacterized protein n=1 Tax=Durusdinium trenchii TaxID=1381693 RepID=A0ABP0JFR3_9DINO